MATKVKLIADGVITPDQITLTTASTGTNTTAPATTAFVQQEISALVDSSPEALNTLNELAAALGDDANFSTTVTNSIATKAPLASPTFTGTATMDGLTVDGGADGSTSYTRFTEYSSGYGFNGAYASYNGSSNELIFGRHNTFDSLTANDIPVMSFQRSTGDISFYEDTGTTAKLFWDASTERLGIGTSIPAAELHVNGDSIANTFKLIANTTVSGSDATIFRPADNTMAFSTNGGERMRIDSVGNITMSGTGALTIPKGTTAQQPTAATGMIRYNTDDAVLEGYVDGNWMNIKTTDKFPVMTDLYARYIADSFTNNGSSTPPTWNDESGNNRNIATTSTTTAGGFWDRSGSTWPSLQTNSANTNGATKEFKCVEFDTSEALALPDPSGIVAFATSGFTFAYVARYKDATNDTRIMDGKGSNNLCGAWGGARGVFFDGSWVVGSGTQHSVDPFDWFIILGNYDTVSSKTKDNNSGGWVSYGTTASPAGWNYVNANYSATGNRYGLNRGNYGVGGSAAEASDFFIAEWCMWDRTLNASEMSTMQSFLETKYGI